MGKTKSFSFFKPTFLTLPEISVLVLAAGVIWFAKWQDRMLAENGYSWDATEQKSAVPKLKKSAAAVPVSEKIPASFSDGFSDVESPPQPVAAVSTIHRTADLEKFLRKFRAHETLHYQNLKTDSPEWEALSKNATVTFGFVEEIFQNAAPQIGEPLTVREVLNDAVLAGKVFQEMEMRFGLDRREIEKFAKKREAGDLPGWAFFVENRL